MKSTYDITSALYKALNVPSITDIIDGEIFRGDLPADRQKQDIQVAVLVNENKYLQTGYVNVNFYCKHIAEGKPNLLKLNEVNTALMAILDNKSIESIRFDVENQSGPLLDKEPGRDGIYFSNLKIKFNNIN